MRVLDEHAILSAIWILASNDETSLVTYKGLIHRLSLPPDYDLSGLIRAHGELFRQGMPASRLDQWKADMRAGRRIPAFIREVETTELRKQLIESLATRDGFRSQFRATNDAPRSEVAVIEWGLNHIERLRKAQSESREATAKSWQMWLVFGTCLLSVAATIVVAIIAAHLKKC